MDVLARIYREKTNWTETVQTALDENLLQRNTLASRRRILREVRQRLVTLHDSTIAGFPEASPEEKRAIALLAVCKCYPFVFSFIRDVLREKLAVFDNELTLSDFHSFWNALSVKHPELDEITVNSRKKLRQVLFRILAEAGLLKSTRNPVITPIFLTPVLEGILRTEGPQFREAFLA